MSSPQHDDILKHLVGVYLRADVFRVLGTQKCKARWIYWRGGLLKKWKEWAVTQRMWEVDWGGDQNGDAHGADALLLLLLSPIGAAPSSDPRLRHEQI